MGAEQELGWGFGSRLALDFGLFAPNTPSTRDPS